MAAKKAPNGGGQRASQSGTARTVQKQEARMPHICSKYPDNAIKIAREVGLRYPGISGEIKDTVFIFLLSSASSRVRWNMMVLPDCTLSVVETLPCGSIRDHGPCLCVWHPCEYDLEKRITSSLYPDTRTCPSERYDRRGHGESDRLMAWQWRTQRQ